MNFSCDQCGRRYSIADEKVAGRRFRLKCRTCEHVITGHGPGAAPAVAAPPVLAPPPAPPPVAPRASPIARTSRPAGSAAPPPLPSVPAGDAGATAPSGAPADTSRPEVPDAERRWLQGSIDDGSSLADAAPSHPASSRPGRRRALLAGIGAVAMTAGIAAALLLWPQRRKQAPRPAPVAAAQGTAPSAVHAPAAPPSAAPGAVASDPAAPAPTPGAGGPAPAASAASVEPGALLAAPADAAASAAPAPSRGKRRLRGGFEPVKISSGGRDRRRKVELASADRRLLDLLDKKADAVPAAAIEKTSLDTGRAALDPTAIERALADDRAAFGACVTKALKIDPRLRVDDRRATLMLTVQPSGVVSACWIAEADLEQTALGRCLVAASRRVVFPAFQGAALDVEAPLSLAAVR